MVPRLLIDSFASFHEFGQASGDCKAPVFFMEIADSQPHKPPKTPKDPWEYAFGRHSTVERSARASFGLGYGEFCSGGMRKPGSPNQGWQVAKDRYHWTHNYRERGNRALLIVL